MGLEYFFSKEYKCLCIFENKNDMMKLKTLLSCFQVNENEKEKGESSSESESSDYFIYTDGSAMLGKQAGYGIVFDPKLELDNVSEAIYEPESLTNQYAELKAIYMSILILIENNKFTRNSKYTIYSDSMYSINCITKWYKTWEKNGFVSTNKKEVKHKEIIQEILHLIQDKRENICFEYVKAHSTNEHNNAADILAKKGMNLVYYE